MVGLSPDNGRYVVANKNFSSEQQGTNNSDNHYYMHRRLIIVTSPLPSNQKLYVFKGIEPQLRYLEPVRGKSALTHLSVHFVVFSNFRENENNKQLYVFE